RRRASHPQEPFPLSRRGRASLPVARQISRPQLVAIIALATVAGAAVRLAVTHGLSLIEVETVDAARLPFGAMITHLVHHGVHPPLQPILVWCCIHLFGIGSFWARLPSLLAGILLVPAVAWLSSELFDRRTTVVAVLLAIVAPILVWYSQDVSGYELVALFGTLSLAEALRATRTGALRSWALFAVWTSLAVWSDWPGWFVVLAAEILVAAEISSRRGDRSRLRRDLVGWGGSTVALASQLVPLGLLLGAQFHGNGGLAGVATVGASGVSFYSAVSNFAWALFGFHPAFVTSGVSAVWPLAMLASLVFVGRNLGRRGRLMLVCGLVPALATLALGLTAPGSFDVRYGLAGIPPLLVVTAQAATSWPRSRLGRTLIVGVLLAMLAGALADQQLDPGNPRRYDFRPAFAQIQREAPRGSVVLLEPGALRLLATRYGLDLPHRALTRSLPGRAAASNVFVVTSFSGRGGLWQLRNREIGALRATRHLISHRSYPGVEVWWFR
ncbi:MAG TPA: glycosyltransferase family 39 protein, partial [Solirubrobacteraceae bacterium]|nr:glycosyltransferase family 39 protein [Solirubrobacteraceae bacterium]